MSPTVGVSNRQCIWATPCCKIVATFFDNFHFVDVRDHMCQGILTLEQHWLTNQCTGGSVFCIYSPSTGRDCLGQHGLASK